jgi:tetratricopeptide (TPR) repeat protein
MWWAKKIIITTVGTLLTFVLFAQHPNRKKIDSLKKILQTKQAINKINCLNAISEEYWWPPHVYPDSISMWATQANNEAANYNYRLGWAESEMHLGVSEIYRKNFVTAEKYLRTALLIFDSLHYTNDEGWCNLWIGQTLYSENDFNQSLAFFNKSLPYITQLNNSEGEGKAWAWMSFLYAAKGI